jgi:hypothetical protein
MMDMSVENPRTATKRRDFQPKPEKTGNFRKPPRPFATMAIGNDAAFGTELQCDHRRAQAVQRVDDRVWRMRAEQLARIVVAGHRPVGEGQRRAHDGACTREQHRRTRLVLRRLRIRPLPEENPLRRAAGVLRELADERVRRHRVEQSRVEGRRARLQAPPPTPSSSPPTAALPLR